MNTSISFLSTKNGKIINRNGKDVSLRGVNLGGWLMMEGYILYGRNIPERVFRYSMEKAYGKKGLLSFTNAFRNSFIREDDFRRISGFGFNCVRIPFNYRLIEDDKRPFKYSKEGLSFLENAG